jgi:Zn-dependent peptidase ImmA (M78 family)
MSEIITGIQPNILQWARDRAGYSVSQVAERFQKRPQVIKDWETGLAAPTYPQLEKLAALYKRPVALFFFPKPPEEPEVQQEFRSIPNSELAELDPTTRYLLRVAHAYQVSLNELNDGKNPDPKKIFRDIQCPDFHNVAEVAQRIREYLAIDMETQTSWRTSDGALKAWREAVERVGVYVFKNSFKQKSISGFCLVDNEFPVIFLNNSTTKNRQIFTLFHELSHLICGVNDISKTDSNLENLSQSAQKLEQLCNALAGEILVPGQDLIRQVQGVSVVDGEAINAWSNSYHVSREVVARRLLDCRIIDANEYKKYVHHLNNESAKDQSNGSGGNYFATQATYLGDKYLQLVFKKYYQGRLSIEQVADYFGVKVKSVAGLESVIQGKVTAS